LEELYGDLKVGPRPKSRPEVKNGRSSAKDGAPEKLRCPHGEAVRERLRCPPALDVELFHCISIAYHVR